MLTFRETGFVVVPNAIPRERLAPLVDAYDAAMARAEGDARIGSTTTRLHDFVNRGPAFDDLYVHPLVLDVCREVLGSAPRLSSFLARTVHPHAEAQSLHADAGGGAWPIVSFIFMLDDFTPDNGATRFVPRSHARPDAPDESAVVACGAAGSVIVYSGAIRHGHSANRTDRRRRSLQGAYVPLGEKAATDWAAAISRETLARISPVAKEILGLA